MNSFKVRFKLLIFYEENSHLFRTLSDSGKGIPAVLYSSLNQSPTEVLQVFTAENGWQLYKQLIVSGTELHNFLTIDPRLFSDHIHNI